MKAHQQPTIKEILTDFGLDGFLNKYEFDDLLEALQERDTILRDDAVNHAAEKVVCKALDTIIEQV